MMIRSFGSILRQLINVPTANWRCLARKDWVSSCHRRVRQMNANGRRTIHYTQLKDLPPDNALCREWNTYRRELPRLLQEGHEGKVALVKGDDIVLICENWDEAVKEGYRRYHLESFMAKPIHEQ